MPNAIATNTLPSSFRVDVSGDDLTSETFSSAQPDANTRRLRSASSSDFEQSSDEAITQPVLAEELVLGHFDHVYRYALRLSGNSTVAEDIAQDVFLRAIKSIHQLRDPAAVTAWLLTIVRNEFARMCQARKLVYGLDEPTFDCGPIAEADHVQAVDGHDWVHQALKLLPVEFRLVVLMFYFEEKSYAEIASELEIPMGTVMSRLNRGRQHLKQALEASQSTSQSPLSTGPRNLSGNEGKELQS
jgi:RNA polymerase sigma-70 factor, ECF subfamily